METRRPAEHPDEHRALDLYREYRDTVRQPAMPPPPKPWARFDELVEQHHGRTFRWWPVIAVAAAACLAAFFLIPRADRPSRQASQLLADSARVELPEDRMLSIRSDGQTFIRPAVMTEGVESDPEITRLRTLFVEARYSWREPLSARSFQDWRGGLEKKRDSVSMIRDRGVTQEYRVRTETPDGRLRSASLTLRATDLRPTSGTFHFEDRTTLEMTEAPASVEQEPPPAEEPVEEVPAGPADTLQVLAALNEIGADFGEPVEVSEDPAGERVLVRAFGLSDERREQITRLLEPMPRVRLDLDVSGDGASSLWTPNTARRETSALSSSRQQLEERLGGTVAFQLVTDHVLEASSQVLARAHAVQVLADKFPPNVEADLSPEDINLLRYLQERHVGELTRLVAGIRVELTEILPPSNDQPPPPVEPWQSGIPILVAAARDMDTLLNELLAGSLPGTSSEETIEKLASEIARFERAVEAQK